MAESNPIREYYQLTKPGVLYGNVLTGVAGFLLAAGYFRTFPFWLFGATIVGMTLVIAAACVLNNVLDQDIDRIMERTKSRGVASGKVPSLHATILSTVLLILGMAILVLGTNWWVVAIGAVGFVVYVWLYGALSKRRSVHGTLVGSISGAMPILAGYVAIADRLDTAAVLLFLMLFFWQFPEFYSIAIYRRKEYAAAHIPVMSVVRGVQHTKRQILAYTALFVVSTLLLSVLGYTGWLYFIVMAAAGIYWLKLAIDGQATKNSDAWARRMFHWSLLILLLLCAMLSVGSLLP